MGERVAHLGLDGDALTFSGGRVKHGKSGESLRIWLGLHTV